MELIGIEGDATVKGKKGQELRTENAAADLIAGDLDLLVIAGGYGPDKLRTDAGVQARSRARRGWKADCVHLPRRLGSGLGRIVDGRQDSSFRRSRTISGTPGPSGRTRKWSSIGNLFVDQAGPDDLQPCAP